MVLTVDVGNTNIVLSAYKDDKVVFTSRIATEASKMEDQYAIDIKNIISLYNCNSETFEGAIISSVVPSIVPALKSAIKKIAKVNAFVVGPGIKTGLNIKLGDPSELGADLVCGAIGALEKYSSPCIIIDMGTATTISAIDKDGVFLGGSICPGVMLSLEVLASKTANLPHINLDAASDIVIGANTKDSITSGIVLGAASMLDGMIDKYRKILGNDTVAVVTGGLAGGIVKHCTAENIVVDADVVSDGLYAIYKKNAKVKN